MNINYVDSHSIILYFTLSQKFFFSWNLKCVEIPKDESKI